MFAKIIPCLRLPRHLGDFWYIIPDQGEQNIHIGSVVDIPFHGRITLGVVEKITSKRPENIETFKSSYQLYSWFPALTKEQIALLLSIAQKFFLSKATLLQSFLPTIPKRWMNHTSYRTGFAYRLLADETEQSRTRQEQAQASPSSQKWAEEKKSPCVVQYTSIADKLSYYSHMIQQAMAEETQILFLVPELHALKDFEQFFRGIKKIISLHRTLPKNDYLHHWLTIQQGNATVVVGTRIAAFAPFSRLKYIILDDEHTPFHKQWERNPRIHARDIAIEMAKILHAQLFFTTPTPTVETYFQILSVKYTRQSLPASAITARADRPISAPHAPSITIVHCKNERSSKKASLLSLPIENILLNNAEQHKTTLIIALKKDLASHLQQQFPQWQIEKLEVRSKKNAHTPVSSSPIIIATKAALYRMQWKSIATIILPFLDEFLATPGFRSNEETLQMLFHIRNKLQNENSGHAEIVLQTNMPQHPVILAFSTNQVDPWYMAELEERQKFCYPPYSRFMKLIYQHHLLEQGDARVKAISGSLKKALVDSAIQHVEIFGPLLQKKTEKLKQKRWVLIIKNTLPETPFPEKLLEHIPSDWIIDLDPLDLL